MTELARLFKDYCRARITQVATGISRERKEEIVRSLCGSPFRQVVQAWSVLDFYDYEHLWAEGFDTYFGYDNKFITAENILNIVHPEDQEAFGKLYYLCLEGLVNMPIPTKDIGHFCISYRMRDAQGNYKKILETNNIIECDASTNLPLVNLAQISILSKQTNNEVYYYFKLKHDEQGSVSIMHDYLSRFDPRVNIFTESELKIARLLKHGYTSRKIADTIFLSKHTIDKYRKNMLEKTGTVNTPQLITYLAGLGVI